MKEAVLIYPHQLFESHPAVRAERKVYLIEEPLYFSQYTFHTQKLILHRASMKAFADTLIQKGFDVRYIDHAELKETHLHTILKEDGVTHAHVVDVVDTWLEQRIQKGTAESAIGLTWYETPQFLTSKKDVQSYWNSHTSRLQHTFYVWQRKRLNILVHGNKPVGGAWSFDTENRKSLPKDIHIPQTNHEHSVEFKASKMYIQEARQYVETHFNNHYGSTDTFSYAVTHEDARGRVQEFLKERFRLFGAYEDAITTSSHTVFHSVLSPYLNNGLLTPQEVLDDVLEYAKKHEVPLSSLEGFVRQLIGWREFMRMVYVCDGTRMRNQNVLSAHRKLKASWWEGTTGLLPIDHAIQTLKQYAYTHHIVRLMVIGNCMSLLGIHPDECYRWFMEWYIDAYDWVMVPNVYGMTLYADGGTIVTKPYISSSTYISKMSDYAHGPWEDIWTALYWEYVRIHADILSKNIRARFSVQMYAQLSEEKKEVHTRVAKDAIRAFTE